MWTTYVAYILILFRLLPGAVPSYNTLAQAAELDHLYQQASLPEHQPSSEGDMSFSDKLDNFEQV